MSIDVKEIREGVTESQQTLADATTGALVGVVDAARNPVGTVRKTVRRLEKRGQPVNRRVERTVERTGDAAMGATVDVVSGNLAERLTLAGLRMARDRARRRDTVGEVLYRGIELLHRGLSSYVEEVGKFQHATEPPTRSGERRSPARRSATGRTRRPARSGSSKRTTSRTSAGGSRSRRAATARTA